MSELYSVAIHYGETVGHIDYNAELKTAEVVLAVPDKQQEIKAYLAEKKEIEIPHTTLRDFTKVVIDPLESVESFKLAMTRLWSATEVLVDWSRPVDKLF